MFLVFFPLSSLIRSLNLAVFFLSIIFYASILDPLLMCQFPCPVDNLINCDCNWNQSFSDCASSSSYLPSLNNSSESVNHVVTSMTADIIVLAPKFSFSFHSYCLFSSLLSFFQLENFSIGWFVINFWVCHLPCKNSGLILGVLPSCPALLSFPATPWPWPIPFVIHRYFSLLLSSHLQLLIDSIQCICNI